LAAQAELGSSPGGMLRVSVLTGPFTIVPDSVYDWRQSASTVAASAAAELARTRAWEIVNDRSKQELERIYAMEDTMPISDHLSVLQKIRAALIDAGTVTGEAFDAILLSAGGKSGDAVVDRNPIETGHL
jgi:hypothetical protein